MFARLALNLLLSFLLTRNLIWLKIENRKILITIWHVCRCLRLEVELEYGVIDIEVTLNTRYICMR